MFYYLVTRTAPIITKVGCFAVNDRLPRPLPERLFADCNIKFQLHSLMQLGGVPCKKGHIKGIVARCAKATRAKGYSYFGIQKYGMIM